MRAPAWLLRVVRLTRREYFADFFITPPVTLALAVTSVWCGFSALWISEFLLGWLAWTLYEYVMHRWGLHRLPVLREIHALHHRNQLDYVAVPPWVTALLYVLLWAAFGAQTSALAVGFSVGYVAYAALHTAFHYVRFKPGDWLYRGDQRHAAHHRRDDVCYGVSTALWDRLMGTEA